MFLSPVKDELNKNVDKITFHHVQISGKYSPVKAVLENNWHTFSRMLAVTVSCTVAMSVPLAFSELRSHLNAHTS